MGWPDRLQGINKCLDMSRDGEGVLAFGGHGHLWCLEILALQWAVFHPPNG